MDSFLLVDNVAFECAGRRGRLWRFASLIPSGCRLPPIHKVMGDHASRAATAGRASPRVDCCISIVLTAGRGHASFLEMLIINEL